MVYKCCLAVQVREMSAAGADIPKVAAMAQRIEDSARMLALPSRAKGERLIWQPASSLGPVTCN